MEPDSSTKGEQLSWGHTEAHLITVGLEFGFGLDSFECKGRSSRWIGPWGMVSGADNFTTQK
jgi:hypothetical protein